MNPDKPTSKSEFTLQVCLDNHVHCNQFPTHHKFQEKKQIKAVQGKPVIYFPPELPLHVPILKI